MTHFFNNYSIQINNKFKNEYQQCKIFYMKYCFNDTLLKIEKTKSIILLMEKLFYRSLIAKNVNN